MKILVNDTNIFIDLHSVGLLSEISSLPYEIHTVDFVVEEVIDSSQRAVLDKLISEGKITVNSFNEEELMDIVDEHSTISGNLSITDCSVCYFARKHRVPLLTGDRRLRKYAEQQAIEVHGILFIFDEMVHYSIISSSVAADKLEELYRLNSRLPKAAIKDRLNRWR